MPTLIKMHLRRWSTRAISLLLRTVLLWGSGVEVQNWPCE
jgi:hypothetical protein